MSKSDRTIEQIIRYLKGLLSNRDRHHLEKEMMQDTFDEEAFDGLNQLTGDQLEADMGKLTGMLNQRTQQHKTILLPIFRRIAAALILLIGIGAVLFFLLRKPVPEFITQDLQREIPKTTQPEKLTGQSNESLQKQDKNISQPSRSVVDKNSGKSDAITELPSEMDEVENIPHQEDAEVADKTEPMASASAGVSVQDSVEPFYITGRIVGADQKALAGVSIMEKGNNKEGALSDINGYFKLSVNDNKAPLTVSRFGYEPVEVATSEVAGKDITLVADPMTLSEIVVIGYGSTKKEKISPASNRKMMVDTLITEIQGPFDLSKPVPPGGSLKAFEKWVEDRIVFDRFNDQQGDYNILVRLTIRKDGTIQSIRVGKEIPAIIAKEYARVINQSPVWQPAQNNGIPVDAEVEMLFTLIIR